MKQLTQNLKTGNMELLEVSSPAMSADSVMVRTHFSLISAGTEGGKVEVARKGYIGKAKAKPEAVKQVIDSLKTDGIASTYKKVMTKLDAPAPLGYSCSGEVIEVGENICDISVGDFVACAGDSAGHAEIITIPRNLCAKIPPNVKKLHAAYTTVASIALQGIRQADLRIGETCAVIGLGLLGQLSVQMLKAAGVITAGIDIEKKPVQLAKKSGADVALRRNDSTIEQAVSDMSGGYGVDAVIITAATDSLDPVELAGKLCRRRGKVVIVGAVPTGFSRETYYKKELQLLMSASYGPGRYDDKYEINGIDYPIDFARWTENRNMQAFLRLLSDKKLNIDLLTTHQFPFEKALDAYKMIVDKTEDYVGIVLQYDVKTNPKTKPKTNTEIGISPEKANIGFIGAGSFAQKFLLPIAQKHGNLIGVATSAGYTAHNIAKKFNFRFTSGDAKDIVSNSSIDTVFIATRHNLHAAQVIEGLKNKKHIFVEKPLCLTMHELEEIKRLYDKQAVQLMIGFNRRFSPLVQRITKLFDKKAPKAINYRINAGEIPADNWIQNKDIGGGRIIGEVCHFVDLCMYIAASPITHVSAFVMNHGKNLNDTLVVNLKFQNQSIATVSYFANGSKAMKKEYLEVFSNGVSAVLDDFRELKIYSKSVSRKRLFSQDKGHSLEVKLFLEAIKKGAPIPIPFSESYVSTFATFEIIESIRKNEVRFLGGDK